MKQKSLVAYEMGFKQPVIGRTLKVNGALFYYTYTDKQLRGRVIDRFLGMLDALVRIPSSRIWGAKAEVRARPVEGLDLGIAAAYLDTKIRKFTGYNNA